MQLEPMQDTLIIRVLSERTPQGLLLCRDSEQLLIGEVIAVGPGRIAYDGTVLPTYTEEVGLKVGDRVLYLKQFQHDLNKVMNFVEEDQSLIRPYDVYAYQRANPEEGEDGHWHPGINRVMLEPNRDAQGKLIPFQRKAENAVGIVMEAGPHQECVYNTLADPNGIGDRLDSYFFTRFPDYGPGERVMYDRNVTWHYRPADEPDRDFFIMPSTAVVATIAADAEVVF